MAQQHIFLRSFVALALTVSSAVGVIHLPPVIANPAKRTNTPISQPILTLSGHTEPIRAIAISPNGQILATGGDDKTIKLWNLQTGKLLFTLTGHLDGVNSIAISPDGQTVVSCSYDKTIKLWNPNTGKLIKTLNGHSAGVSSVVITADGKTLVSAGRDKTIKLWNFKNGELQRTLKMEVFTLAISPDGKILFTGGEDGGKIRLWNLGTGKLQRTLTPPKPKNPPFENQRASAVLSLAISPDGKTLVNGGYDDSFQSIQQTDETNIKVWNLKTGKVAYSFSVGASVDTVAISPDGKTFSNGGLDREVKLWDLQTGKLVKKFSGHAGGIYGLAFSRDGKILVSGSGDKSIKVWGLLP